MSTVKASNMSASTQFLETGRKTYAYRRFVNGVYAEMIPVGNSYWLSENLPNAVLLVYPDSGHGSLFQFHESFTRHAAAFLSSDSQYAPYSTEVIRSRSLHDANE